MIKYIVQFMYPIIGILGAVEIDAIDPQHAYNMVMQYYKGIMIRIVDVSPIGHGAQTSQCP